ncbi:motility protein A [Rhodospirillum rubrum]|uniref:MotA/TolQ/ExbB proton channel n=1 Tax=Rhodospirillum rubrum (strain ATCC 11170 / ATH 1.1.1 / DSM 467 / LMG 4362 / NCIMB 8255 / S1) TaxID=269796 RepID=Q2RX00_RHORT|nr:MotA/TolQ/ExbB proton channel family protein [Rhodospirillum rubrum]ABC21345.1 MotA/TolQ/ExbB proton channel [Rhodospirillum rubrum ATCC 11170]AEO47025.1 MotA/TolQ/ExbB proton channel [Rhodospirillum rubrum F11]MBK1665448.1 flagellar motor protein MotA [Rhodospirillum rubrum]MBK1677357.1 flagellar motor protein MotA [Rhodospirillum rubrum]MBK5952931.1 flagellar motor protein MotA [Rhodospirillum rubrum]
MADSRDIEGPGPSRKLPDLATVAGIGGALALIVTALVLGGSPRAFFDLPSILIVVLGTLAVTVASFTVKDIGVTVAMLRPALTQSTRPPRAAALKILALADFCRKSGILKIQGPILESLRDEPFLHKGMGLVVDGLPEPDVEAILAQDIHATQQRLARATSVLRRAAEVAPAMGLIGTLIGLVQMLGNLNNPAVIGPSMAVALLTTFYGAIMGNVVFLPLAGKLERNGADDTLVRRIYLVGILSVARKENPRRLEMLLNSALPPAQRVDYYG